MSDKMRWRYGDTNPAVAAVDSGTVIEIGDLLYQDVDDAKPASMCTAWADLLKDHAEANQDPEELQEEFARTFLGVAMQRSRSGDTDPVRVATTGVFEFDCVGVKCELGDLFGVCAGDEKLLNQTVECVTDSRYAIGRVSKRSGVVTTSVLIDVRSAVMTGGVKGTSPSGV